jgi:lysozyme family protein
MAARIALTARFYQAVGITLEFEGGLSNGVSDLGGATAYGISSAAHPEHQSEIARGSFSRSDAIEVYREEYWDRIMLINDIPGPIAFLLFDSRVHGHQNAYVVRLQAFMNRQRLADLKVDGKWGPLTARAARDLSASNVARFLEQIRDVTPSLAESLAVRQLREQAAHGLPLRDYSRGFESRLTQRVNRAAVVV